MDNCWYKVGRRYFCTDLCGFNEFVCITFHDGHIVKTHNGFDVAVTGHTIELSKIDRFLSRCELIDDTNEYGIPEIVLNAVYKGKPVPEYRKAKSIRKGNKANKQFCLTF